MKIKLLLLILILLIGISLRIYKLGFHDFWYDEILSIEYSKHLGSLKSDQNPPLYYIFLNVWRHFFKENEFFIRLPSVIFSILTILLIYKIGKEFFDYKVGLVSSFLFSISPMQIWYSQEARVYTLSALLILLSAYFFILALIKNKYRYWITFTIISIASIYSNYYAFFTLFAESIVFCDRRYRKLIKKWLVCCIFIFLTFVAWIPVFSKQFLKFKEIWWLPNPSLNSILITFENFNVGYNAISPIYKISLILFGFLFLWSIIYTKERGILWILLSFVITPILLAFFISQWKAVYLDRQLACFLPFYILILSNGIIKLKLSSLKSPFLIAIILFSTYSLYNYFIDYMPSDWTHHIGVHTKKPFKPAIKYIKERFSPGDVAFHTNPLIADGFDYYWKFDNNVQYFVFDKVALSKDAINGYWTKTFYNAKKDQYYSKFILELSDKFKDIDFKRIWLISAGWERENGKLINNSQAVRTWANKNFRLLDEEWIEGILIGLYEK